MHRSSWRKTVDFDRFTSDSETFRQDYRFYANTLFANILFASELHRKFKDFNITTYSIDPGETFHLTVHYFICVIHLWNSVDPALSSKSFHFFFF